MTMHATIQQDLLVMGETASTAFIHSCLKMPRQCHNTVRSRPCRSRGSRPASSNSNGPFDSVASYLEFYTNIPDYSDLHDLSDSEFYAKLNDIKATQKQFISSSNLLDGSDSPGDNTIERPSSQSSMGSKLINKNNGKKYLDVTVVRPQFKESQRNDGRMKPPPKIVLTKDFDLSSDLPGRRKSPDLNSSLLEPNWEKGDLKTDDNATDFHQNRVASPCHNHLNMCHSMSALSLHSPGVHTHDHSCVRIRSKSKNSRQNYHDVPLLSRIPLFDKIMAEQEERRRINHERYSNELRASVQPFSFTKREEEEKQGILHSRSCSSIDLQTQPRPGSSQFRANPVPKSLFSDSVYERMREDQFYRALRKRIRADEMLKNAALPPSMEAREKLTKGKSKSLDCLEGRHTRKMRSRSRAYRLAQECISRNVRASENRNTGKSAWLGNKTRPSSTTDSSVDCSPNASTIDPRPRARPNSAFSVSRSNLASVLRIQTSRKRLENEMKEQLADHEQQERARFKARLIRLSPAWRKLDYSTEEDLALRLAQRRQEARQRGFRHRKLMEDIYGRVHQIPPLFQEPNRIHHCHSPTRNKNEKHEDYRAKSLECNLEQMGIENKENECYSSRKSKSFYIDRTEIKSYESSQIKSDGSKEDYTISDID